MKGFPKYFKTRFDYAFVVDEVAAGRRPGWREPLVRELAALKESGYMLAPVWPDGYDPASADPDAEPVAPVRWQLVRDPNGKINRLDLPEEVVEGWISSVGV